MDKEQAFWRAIRWGLLMLVNDPQQSRLARRAFQLMANAIEERYGIGAKQA